MKVAPRLASLALLAGLHAAAAAAKPNVLFLAVDDLRPEMGCYGQAHMKTPNLDALAARSVLFERAYCNIPVCGASRASLMTGIRGTRTRFVGFDCYANQDAKGAIPLNGHFKAAGYTTISLGKVFHHPDDFAEGWSEPAWRPKAPMYAKPENLAKAKENPGKRKYGPPFEEADVPDDFYGDGKLADEAVSRLRQLAGGGKPFFLAVGFFKPHLPFVAPKKYWDLYPEATVKMPENYYPPKDAPEGAVHSSGELRAYTDVPKQGVLPEDLALKLIRGYRAATSYTDAQIGKVLAELDALKLRDSTVVILWGDHGWNLGEHTMWCKHCCFETSMRVPLLVGAPMSPGFKAGGRTMAIAEYIDIYPTLCDLAGLEKPRQLQGMSFAAQLADPSRPLRDAAIGRFGNGDTIRSATHRFTIYSDKAGKETGRMLYDHGADPDENVNIAAGARHAGVVKELAARLEEGMAKTGEYHP